MGRRNQYQTWFEFVDTEQQAIDFVEQRKKMRRKAGYASWTSSDGREHKFVVWCYV